MAANVLDTDNFALSPGDFFFHLLNKVYVTGRPTPIPLKNIKLRSNKRMKKFDSAKLALHLLQTVSPANQSIIAQTPCNAIVPLVFRRNPIIAVDAQGWFVPRVSWGQAWNELKSHAKKTGQLAVLNNAIREFTKHWFSSVVKPCKLLSVPYYLKTYLLVTCSTIPHSGSRRWEQRACCFVRRIGKYYCKPF